MEKHFGLPPGGDRLTTGLVIGKFYPPHAGHAFLIETALGRVDDLTVVVCDGKGQNIPADARARWLKEIHPRARVRVVADAVPDDDSKGWADYTRSFLGYAPDVVFTSEDYGERYARFLGARHVLVDRKRTAVPLSATAVRQDPLRHWGSLAPCVREHYALRVAVVGAESTGKTTLARALAEQLKAPWVPEYGREYSDAHAKAKAGAAWSSEEFVLIAREQNRREDQAARKCDGVLICDTDAFCTGLWHERYLKRRFEEVEALARSGAAVTFLCDAAIPFVQDGTRDGETIRPWMHQRFMERLSEQKRNYILLSGPHEQRLSRAVAAVTKVRACFTGPR